MCGTCGTPREAELAAAEITRFATVVTSDLKGSTALGERLDPESLREVLTSYFDEMRAVFESHGGTIEKIIGDAIVAVFGLPGPPGRRRPARRRGRSREPARPGGPQRPARGELGCPSRGPDRRRTGDVIFGEASGGQHVLTGDTMDLSSAIEQNAPPLEVLLAGSTYELVRDRSRPSRSIRSPRRAGRRPWRRIA